MTTEENFFVRQDVTGFFTMLQGSPGAGWGFEPGAGWSGDSGPGAGCGGDSGPGRRVCGDSGPSAGWEFFGVRWEIFYLFAVFSPFG